MSTLTDEELVVRCKTELPADTRSYAMLVQRHQDRVYSLAYRVVSNKEEAEDITQDVFVKVYHGLRKFEQQASFSSWLYRVTINSALDALDKIKHRSTARVSVHTRKTSEDQEETDLINLQASSVADPEESVIQGELRECIKRVLKKLDREQARLLIMRDFDDLSYDEIARLLQLGLSAVKMRIHRSRLAFQEVFNQLCGRIYLNFSIPSHDQGTTKKG